jgi:hypothetical protein
VITFGDSDKTMTIVYRRDGNEHDVTFRCKHAMIDSINRIGSGADYSVLTHGVNGTGNVASLMLDTLAIPEKEETTFNALVASVNGHPC